jgi:hypothetical protein
MIDWACAVTTEAAQAIDNKPILPTHRIADDKSPRPGRNISVMEVFRMVFGSRAFSVADFVYVFIDQFA